MEDGIAECDEHIDRMPAPLEPWFCNKELAVPIVVKQRVAPYGPHGSLGKRKWCRGGEVRS